ARLQGDRRARGGRRDQRPHLRRRRLRAGVGARSGARAPGRARGEDQRRARARRVRSVALTVRVAVDIGGTFTDATLIDEESGTVSIAKTLTTPTDPSEGFMRAVERALEDATVGAPQVGFVVHATTV